MTFYQTEAKITKDPIMGLIKQASLDDAPNKFMAVIGVAADDNGNIIIPEAVKETAEELSKDASINMSYAPSSGIPDLAELMGKEILGNKTTTRLTELGVYSKSIVCSGGTNALSTTLMACTSEDDTIITHTPHWPGYESIMLGIARKPYACFDLLDSEQNFNIKGLKEVINSVQESKLTLMLNTPFDNPLGKDFGSEAWKQIAELLRSYSSEFPNREILLILDTAYLDFGPGGKDYKRMAFLVDLFETVNSKNLNVVIAGSVSKSFAMYGARVGVATLLTKQEEIAKQWIDIAGGVIRGTFSNASRHGQDLTLRILTDNSKLANVHQFQEDTVKLIQKRTEFFLNCFAQKAKDWEEQMELIKPDGGFFVSIKLYDKDFAERMIQEFIADHTYIPLISGQYLRVPTCGLNEEKLDILTSKIIKAAQNAQGIKA